MQGFTNLAQDSETMEIISKSEVRASAEVGDGDHAGKTEAENHAGKTEAEVKEEGRIYISSL